MKKPIIGIIGGKGKMGKAFARFFVELGYEVIVSDLKTKLKPLELVRKSDVVIISVPIDKTEQLWFQKPGRTIPGKTGKRLSY